MSRRYISFALLIAALVGLTTSSCAAGTLTVQYFQHAGGPARKLTLEGRIEVGDSSKIFDAIRETSGPILEILIASPGGDVEEAIWISSYVNAAFIKVVPAQTWTSGICEDDDIIDNVNCVCYSACAIIWLAAERKIDGDSVGVHRPYFEKKHFADLPLEEAKRRYESMLGEVVSYLRQQVVPERIIEIMVSTPSSDIQLLSRNDRNGLLLSRPYIHELLDARCISEPDRQKQVESDQAMVRAISEGDVASQLLITSQIERSFSASPYRKCVSSEEYRAAKKSQKQNPFSIIETACRNASFLTGCRPAVVPKSE